VVVVVVIAALGEVVIRVGALGLHMVMGGVVNGSDLLRDSLLCDLCGAEWFILDGGLRR
jgi:hypothetical protein